MLERRFTCPHCGESNSYVWRQVRLLHDEERINDELEVIEIACTECGKTVAFVDPKIIKRS